MNLNIKPKILKNILDGPEPVDHAVLLTHKNIYIFPSKIGIFWFFLLLIMFLIGLNYRNNLVLIFCFFLFSISMISLIYNFYQLYNLKIIPGRKGKNVFAKDVAEFFIYIRDESGNKRYLHVLSEGFNKSIEIEPNSTKIAKYGCVTEKRGILKAPKFTIISYYPFGIFRCWTVLKFKDSVVVYPKPRIIPMRYNYIQDKTKSKNEKFLTEKGIEDFYSLDKYNPANPISRIYWKLYAQRGELVEKIFSSERSDTLILDLNMFKHHSLEQSLEMLVYLVLECHSAGYRYGLKLGHHEVKPSNGIEHKHICLTALAMYPMVEVYD